MDIRHRSGRESLRTPLALVCLSHSLNVFSLVLFGDFDIFTSRLQLDIDNLAKAVIFDREGVLDDVGDVVLATRNKQVG